MDYHLKQMPSKDILMWKTIFSSLRYTNKRMSWRMKLMNCLNYITPKNAFHGTDRHWLCLSVVLFVECLIRATISLPFLIVVFFRLLFIRSFKEKRIIGDDIRKEELLCVQLCYCSNCLPDILQMTTDEDKYDKYMTKRECFQRIRRLIPFGSLITLTWITGIRKTTKD